jgi:hypothetical protein
MYCNCCLMLVLALIGKTHREQPSWQLEMGTEL